MEDPRRPDRREFLRGGLAAGAAGAFLHEWPEDVLAPRRGAGTPIVLTSHHNETGRRAMEASWTILTSGGSALDAVEKGANVIEVDPEDHSVGYGGLPNEHGVVQLDASVMDGSTYSAGAVASLENIKTPSSVARLVMERTDHVLLVGPGALAFARSFGFREEELLTEEAREIWLRWREERGASDDWGPPDHLRGLPGGGGLEAARAFHYGTTNVLAVDAGGNVAGITTTSGLSWKIPGRVGDSPIVGAGLYVDNDVGAAGATGRGEDVIKSCASFFIVMRMREGRSPQEACEDAVEMIVGRYRKVNPAFVPEEKFVALNKDGAWGCTWMGLEDLPEMTVADAQGVRVVEGTGLYPPQGRR